MTEGGEEVEITFRVVADGERRTADEVAELREVAGYRLGPPEAADLADVYFDTPDGALEAAGLALRLRRRGDGRRTVAVKGDERRLEGGAIRRLERERAWSGEAPAEIRAFLEARGAPLGEAAAAETEAAAGARDRADRPERGGRSGGDPEDALRALGLAVVQRRTTRRRRRSLVEEVGGGAVGELAVDRVVYRPPDGSGTDVVHREVEVEGRPPDAERVVADVARGLERRFGEALRAWRHNKLATGKALERLAERGELEGLTGPGGELTEQGYERVTALLEAGRG